MLRNYVPMVRVPTGGPWSFTTRPSYVAAAPPMLDDDAVAEALATYVQRYLAGFGPASIADTSRSSPSCSRPE